MTNMLNTRAALNTPSGHLPSSHEFSEEDDEKNSKYFDMKLRFGSNCFCFVVKFRFGSLRTAFHRGKFRFVSPQFIRFEHP